MSDPPITWRYPLGRIAQWLLAFVFGSFILLTVCVNVGLEFVAGIYEAGFHLVFGFIFFLAKELPAFLSDFRGWLTATALFLVAFGMAQVMGKKLLRASSWTGRHTRSLALVLLGFLVCPLVIGGVWRNLKGLASEPVLANGNAVEGYENVVIASELYRALQQVAANQQCFPDSLGSLETRLSKDWVSATFRSEHEERPPELPIYLAAGAPTSLDPSFPLLISAPYRRGGGKWRRMVITLDGTEHGIDDAETDTWVQRAFEIRRSLASP